MAKVIYKIDSKYSFGSEYGSNFKYHGIIIKFPHIVRGLKSVRETSGYIDYVSIWDEETNKDIVRFDDFGTFATYVQFFSEFCDITDEFIKKYNVEPYHISLIRRMYFDYDDYDDFRVNLGYKRPYGNSYVIGDIADEYLRYVKDDKYDSDKPGDWFDENEDMLLKIHMRTLEIFDLALEELYMPLEYKNSDPDGYGHNGWQIGQTWYRKQKLERVLK